MGRNLKISGAATAMVLALAGSSVPANTQSWNPYGRCYDLVEGIGTGTGVFGRGSNRARAAARANWESAAASLYGIEYAKLSYAREVRWDCKRRALMLAKCVVTAKPCGARLRG